MNLKKIFLLLTLVFIYSCAYNNKPVKLTITECFYPDNPKEKAPLWVCGASVEVDGAVVPYTGVGSATKSKAGVNFTVQQATASARLNLAQQLDAQIVASVKDSIEARGYGDEEQVNKLSILVNEQITKQNLIGSKVLAQSVNSQGTIYIIVGLNTNAYKAAIKDLFSAIKDKSNLTASQFNNIQSDFEKTIN